MIVGDVRVGQGSRTRVVLRAALGAALCFAFLPAAALASSAPAGWLPPVDISATGEHAGVPQVVLDAQGNATAVWEAWNGEDTVVESAYRPAGGSWQAPADLSLPAGEITVVSGEHDAQSPRIAVDGHGDTTIVWERYGGTNRIIIEVAYRPAGGSWQAPASVGEVHTEWAPEPWIAVDELGDATVVWNDAGVIESAYQPAGGSWGAPVAVSSGGEAVVPQAAVDAQGDATVTWMAQDGSEWVVQSAYRPAGGSWEAPTELSQDGEEGGDPHIALDAHGDTMVAWDGHYGESEVVRAAYRPDGGSWQAPADVSTVGDEAQSLRVALDAQGDALIAWSSSTKEVGGYSIVQAAYRPAGGSWEAPTNLSEGGENAFPSDVVFDQEGNAAVVWERSNGTNDIVQAAYRPPGGKWQEPANLSEEGRDGTDAVLVLDAPGDSTAADGDATVVWTSSDGGCDEIVKCDDPAAYTIQAAGYDAVEPPQAIEAPATGEAGTPVSVAVPAASPLEVYSPLLSFGDGTSSSATSATHTYAAPGEYTVKFSSTDVLGYASSTQRAIVIGPTGQVVSPPVIPVIESESVSNLSEHDATLEATIDTSGLYTGYEFQIDKNGSYDLPGPVCPFEFAADAECDAIRAGEPLPAGLLEPQPQYIPAGSGKQSVSLDLASIGATLQPGTTYHYRVIAANGAGPTIDGPDQTFTTLWSGGSVCPIGGSCPANILACVAGTSATQGGCACQDKAATPPACVAKQLYEPTPTPKPALKVLTRAEKLTKALKACAEKPKKQRASCVRSAEKKYGATDRLAGKKRQTN